jgi:ACS family allantoate permease-like MFS transporter
MWQNCRREKKAAESGNSKDEQERLGREMGERDVTNLNNPYFRYTL